MDKQQRKRQQRIEWFWGITIILALFGGTIYYAHWENRRRGGHQR